MSRTAEKAPTLDSKDSNKVVELKRKETNLIDEFAAKIAECEAEIKRIESLKRGNAGVQKKRAKQLKDLEKEIVKQTCLRDFKVNDFVTKKAKDGGQLGVIIEIINGNLLEYLISWEGTVTPIPSSFEVVEKIDPDQVAWQWKEGKLIRTFDCLECNSLPEIVAQINEIKKKKDQVSKKQITYLEALWNGLVKDVYSKDDLVRYQSKVYIISGHKTPARSARLCCLIKRHGGEKDDPILADPIELEVLSMSQQFLNIAAIREYPCRVELLISELAIDQRLQQRVKYNKEAIAKYQENVDEMPAVKVKLDHLGNYWLWDGFHTVYACKAIDKLTVPAEVERGSFDEAFLASLGANAKRGVQRTKADRQRAIVQALRAREDGTLLDEKGKRPSNRWIAAKIQNVSPGTIDNLYNQLYTAPKEKEAEPEQKELIPQSKEDKKTEKTTNPTEIVTEKNDQQALTESESQKHDLPETGATASLEDPTPPALQTTVQDSFVDVSKATERAKVPYAKGEVVYIRNDSEDPRVKGLLRQQALIEDSGAFIVDIRLWTGEVLKNLSKHDVAKTQDAIASVVPISQANYSLLMKNCDSWEAATKLINDIIGRSLSPEKEKDPNNKS